jgi:hypothetical protein
MQPTRLAIALLCLLPTSAVAQDMFPPGIAPNTSASLRSITLSEAGSSGPAYRNRDTLLGAWGGNASYGALSFNNTLAFGSLNGFFGSSSDPNLYANTQGSYFFRVGGVVVGQLNGSVLSLTGAIIETNSSTPASSTATCTIGQHAWDASYEYRCIATNSWKRAALTAW